MQAYLAINSIPAPTTPINPTNATAEVKINMVKKITFSLIFLKDKIVAKHPNTAINGKTRFSIICLLPHKATLP